MYTGGCYCGAVRFEITSGISDIIYCHCSQCRKLQGSAFATNGVVNVENFRIILGEGSLTKHPLSATQARYFCQHCGSPIKSENTKVPGKVRVRLGTIDSDIKEQSQAHIFVDSKANWEHICDELPQYKEYEPERSK
ncbi:Gfa-like protein [hydrothermal vent metagenome]|uniref:Gfa-like protein n=1 Tax=hydrothermal vent metagenome TaxID=652676 RepID=A0A3B0ZZU4_9ZZZZ